jgi:hypothetical protein
LCCACKIRALNITTGSYGGRPSRIAIRRRPLHVVR